MKKMITIMVFVWIVLSGLIAGQLFISNIASAPDPDLPDLTISQNNITLSPATPIAGEPVTINATIWNIGNADATNVEVNFYEEDILISSENVDIPKYRIWKNYTVDSAGDVGEWPSIAIDDANGIHISYWDGTNDDLKYAYKPDGGSWNIYTIDTINKTGLYTSIAVDKNNGVHISYFEGINDDLKYAYKANGSNWIIETIDNSGEVGSMTSIAVDGTNGVHISYFDDTNNDLKYAYKPRGGSWTNYTIDSTGSVGSHASIAVDSTNGVHISYFNYTDWSLKYAYKPDGGSWSNQTVDTSAEVGYYTSIAVDKAIGVHISYYDITNQDLKYAYKANGGNWINHTLDTRGNIGSATSIIIDNHDGVHISYRDSEDKDLEYAYKPIGEDWTLHTIDSLDAVGTMTSIAVDDTNGIHISYRDYTNRDLKYANGIVPLGNLPVSISWTPLVPGLKNITVKLDENNEIQELNETNNEATISITVYSSDNDLDEMPDWWEKIYGLDPSDPLDANLDPDLDGLTNLEEFLNGSKPNNNETDGDSLGDGFEVIFSKTKPNNWDTNGNGIGDGLEFIANQGYAGSMQSLPNDWIGMTITWQNYTIYIKTNSSVLEGEFDKEEQKLKIKVSGEDGTQGVTEIEVPKSLCDSEDIEIILDGELINYTLTEDDTYYYIHIEYYHSIHELSARFGDVGQPPRHPMDEEEGSLANIYLLFLIIALVAIVLLLVVIIRNRNESEDIGVHELPPDMISILLEKKHDEGKITDETFKDAKSLLEKFRND